MRKYVTIVGVGRRMAGIGKKSGQAYDFTPLALTYEDPKFTGLRCATVNVNKDALGDFIPGVGEVVEMVMHEDFNSGRLYVDAVL